MFGQHPFRDPAGVLPAELLVPSPGRPRRVAKVLVGSFLLALLAAMLTPWIQNVPGDGRVIAYAPVERRQRIEAPTKGRVIAWHVNEGQRVREGEGGMRECAGVEEEPVRGVPCIVDGVDERALVIRLERPRGGAAGLGLGGDLRVDLRERRRPVDLGLPDAEQVQVRPVEHQDAGPGLAHHSRSARSFGLRVRRRKRALPTLPPGESATATK